MNSELKDLSLEELEAHLKHMQDNRSIEGEAFVIDMLAGSTSDKARDRYIRMFTRAFEQAENEVKDLINEKKTNN